MIQNFPTDASLPLLPPAYPYWHMFSPTDTCLSQLECPDFLIFQNFPQLECPNFLTFKNLPQLECPNFRIFSRILKSQKVGPSSWDKHVSVGETRISRESTNWTFFSIRHQNATCTHSDDATWTTFFWKTRNFMHIRNMNWAHPVQKQTLSILQEVFSQIKFELGAPQRKTRVLYFTKGTFAK